MLKSLAVLECIQGTGDSSEISQVQLDNNNQMMKYHKIYFLKVVEWT